MMDWTSPSLYPSRLCHCNYVITFTSSCLHFMSAIRSPSRETEHRSVYKPLFLRHCNYVIMSLLYLCLYSLLIVHPDVRPTLVFRSCVIYTTPLHLRHHCHVVMLASWLLGQYVHLLLIVRSPRKRNEHHPVCTPLYLRDCNYVTLSLSHSPFAYPEYSNTNTAESVYHYTYIIVNTS